MNSYSLKSELIVSNGTGMWNQSRPYTSNHSPTDCFKNILMFVLLTKYVLLYLNLVTESLVGVFPTRKP